MIKKVGLGVLGVLALVFGYAGLQPAEYLISRQIVINGSADKIFPHINSAKVADAWAPWLEVDPAAKMTYSGPDAGVGARASWDSTGQLGTGSAMIIQSVANERVIQKLEYTKPMAMTQESTYELKPNGNQTTMIWRVTGTNSVVERVAGLFINIDKMVGGMFEKGLNNLKNVVEKGSK